MKSFGLTHIQLAVKDLSRSETFYSSLFEMKEIMRFGETCVMLQTPGSHEVITLNADPGLTSDIGKMGGIAHFGFRLSEEIEMTEVLAQVSRAGGTPIDHGRRGKNKSETYAFFCDPDGYEIEVFWMPAD